MSIKLTPADIAFSKCVRERAEWTCERCGKVYVPPTQALHCSHFIGRGKWGTRFEPLNAFAHCMGCHSYFEGDPDDFVKWVKEQIGVDGYDIIIETKDNIVHAKEMKQTKGKGEIAKHYRNEHKKMLDLRSQGVTGRIEFVGY